MQSGYYNMPSTRLKKASPTGSAKKVPDFTVGMGRLTNKYALLACATPAADGRYDFIDFTGLFVKFFVTRCTSCRHYLDARTNVYQIDD